MSIPQSTIPDSCSHQRPPGETPTPIPCLLVYLGKPSSDEFYSGSSGLHFAGHSSACIPGSLPLSRTNRDQQSSGTTSFTFTQGIFPTWDNQQHEASRVYKLCLHPWKPAATRTNSTWGLLISQKTSSTCSPRGLLSSGPAGLQTLVITGWWKSIRRQSTKARAIWYHKNPAILLQQVPNIPKHLNCKKMTLNLIWRW